MFCCQIIKFLFSFIPFKALKGYLVSHHMENCPSCQKELVGREEARSFLIELNEVKEPRSFWPAVQGRIEAAEGKEAVRQPFLRPGWRWAVAAASFLVVVMVAVLIYKTFTPSRIQQKELTKTFQINYLKIENEPAQAFIFQPKDSDLIIIWAEKIS